MELPIAFRERMKELLQDDLDAFLTALERESAVKGLRVNTEKVSIDAFLKNAPFSLSEIPYVRGGFILSEGSEAGKHPYHHAGAYYMQDPGAMAAVAAIPDEILDGDRLRVLDLCAAPGGKTTQIAARIAEKGGVVVANEYNAARSRILAGNIERMGLSNVVVTNADSKYLAEWYPGLFDLVVVDAPCSGEGMFRKNDRAIEEWSVANVEMCARRQREILENGTKCLRPGGYLLYSTCTYSVEENEGTVADFLSRHPSFSLVPCSEAVRAFTADGVMTDGMPSLALARRFYPHVALGEGQFAVLLQREGDDRVRGDLVKDSFAPLSKADRSVVDTFAKETVGEFLRGVGMCGGNAVAFPYRESGTLPLPPFGVVAVGAAIGELRKGRIVPHHHYFMAYGAEMQSRVTLDPSDERVLRYLAGEEIDVPAECRGYTAVLLAVGDEAVALGGGKASGGRLKNHYPKGLRVR